MPVSVKYPPAFNVVLRKVEEIYTEIATAARTIDLPSPPSAEFPVERRATHRHERHSRCPNHTNKFIIILI